MQIVDAHHHYWDPLKNYHPWLRDEPMIAFRYGDYSSIRQAFMPPEYDAVSARWDVLATVTMEGEWDPTDPLGEVSWIEQLAADTGRPAAHVAQAWLDRADFPEVLAELEQSSIVRSVRHKPVAHARPGMGAGGMQSDSFKAGYRQLGQTRLHFDLQTPWWHLPELPALVEAAPDTRVVINHTGLPADRSEQGIAGWRAAMQQAASLEQTVVKISGLGVAGQPWTVESNRDIVLRTIDLFGPRRCMFASNFPVDGLCATFDEIFDGFDQITCGFTEEERHAMFVGTASDIYQIGLAGSSL